MEIGDLIKQNFRNYEEEKKVLENFKFLFKGIISSKHIDNTLKDNGFNGMYIVNNDIFSQLTSNKNTMGFYNLEHQIIILNEVFYKRYEFIGLHELGHAYLNGRILKELNIDNEKISYGYGIEEGAVSLLMSLNNIKDLDKCNSMFYKCQSKFFQQINVLYKHSDVRSYENLLIHLFKEPTTFISLIEDIYVSLIKHKFDSYYGTRSAYYLIEIADLLTNLGQESNLYNFISNINSLYLAVSDDDIKIGKKENSLFSISNCFRMTMEEKLFYALFHTDRSYYERQIFYLEQLLFEIQEYLEDNIDDKKMSKNLML